LRACRMSPWVRKGDAPDAGVGGLIAVVPMHEEGGEVVFQTVYSEGRYIALEPVGCAVGHILNVVKPNPTPWGVGVGDSQLGG
jgi:hypothetical protein